MPNERTGKPQSTHTSTPLSSPWVMASAISSWLGDFGGSASRRERRKMLLKRTELLKIQSKRVNSELYQHIASGIARYSSSKRKVPKWIKVKIKGQNFCLAPCSSQLLWHCLDLWSFLDKVSLSIGKSWPASRASQWQKKKKKSKGSNPNPWHFISTTVNLCLSSCQHPKLNGQHCSFLMPILPHCF